MRGKTDSHGNRRASNALIRNRDNNDHYVIKSSDEKKMISARCHGHSRSVKYLNSSEPERSLLSVKAAFIF